MRPSMSVSQVCGSMPASSAVSVRMQIAAARRRAEVGVETVAWADWAMRQERIEAVEVAD